MSTITVKGHTIPAYVARDSFDRKAIQFRNTILETLKHIGVAEHQTDIPLETVAFRKATASAAWYFEGHHLFFSYDRCSKFVENLYVVSKIIALEVHALFEGTKSPEDFMTDFKEDDDIVEKRKHAREILGVSHDTKDMELINQRYKHLAKEHHPDKPTGDTEKFKQINHAHKTLKRELE